MQYKTSNQPIFNDCWNQIGVTGDRSCPELKTFIHCRNCPVYSLAGRGLLEREPPPGYINEWTNLLVSQSVPQRESALTQLGETISVIIFRLGVEWLALSAKLFKEVTQPCVIHTIPHRSNEILLGIVNIRGEILMCVSLSHLLGLEDNPANSDSEQSKIQQPLTLKSKTNVSSVMYQRMVVVEIEGNRWVFPVDEIFTVQRFHANELLDAPAVISNATYTYTKWIINWQDKKVNYLDDELLFYTLNRKIT
ncbi:MULTISPECIES: chemotaxis protein CheW [Moorena]|uniref:Chemotaxis protein CheW n=2 Tax=Moorena TaxID=1155738 RepID=A0A1U7N3V5_9CYAN|nr:MULTISPECIES: chemotaxis protein CheW [Moorena]NEO11968.1 chemotaxis protein CheW [Moorena sp. SIO3E8]NEP99017.1 chemotaxis protein CheW [Moorena sp. SIO3F7]OLT59829.1 chemotaxis protein CheW [Moorena bouillonii PNG]OLT60632.1 chemotaxis protein CheW [Moorena bouillonii PNG]